MQVVFTSDINIIFLAFQLLDNPCYSFVLCHVLLLVFSQRIFWVFLLRLVVIHGLNLSLRKNGPRKFLYTHSFNYDWFTVVVIGYFLLAFNQLGQVLLFVLPFSKLYLFFF
jgi:hypothetical protein